MKACLTHALYCNIVEGSIVKSRPWKPILVAAIIAFVLCLAGCGIRIGDDAIDKHLVFDSAYTFPNDDSTQMLYVFCTLNGDEQENIHPAADQAYIKINDTNTYKDSYSMNKDVKGRTLNKTGYKCVTDLDTIYAGTGEVQKVVFEYRVGKNDFQTDNLIELYWVSYQTQFRVEDVTTVESLQEISELAN